MQGPQEAPPNAETRQPGIALPVIAALLTLVLFWLIATFDPIPAYTFASTDGRFRRTECPGKNHTLDHLETEFASYQTVAPEAELVRLEPKPWWNPWEWPGLITNRRWSYPYQSANSIPDADPWETVWSADQDPEAGD